LPSPSCFDTLWTLTNVPYYALTAELTGDYAERLNKGPAYALGLILGGLAMVVDLFPPPQADVLGVPPLPSSPVSVSRRSGSSPGRWCPTWWRLTGSPPGSIGEGCTTVSEGWRPNSPTRWGWWPRAGRCNSPATSPTWSRPPKPCWASDCSSAPSLCSSWP
jgi:hypothetical protein